MSTIRSAVVAWAGDATFRRNVGVGGVPCAVGKYPTGPGSGGLTEGSRIGNPPGGVVGWCGGGRSG